LEEKESAGQLGTPGNYEIFDFPFVSAQYLKIINKRNNSTDTAIKNDISIFQVNFGITVLSEGGNGFALIPRGEKPGHYFFGNKNGNYGLEQDRWFSVSGYVVSIEEGKKADLVMRVNSEEQRMTLQEGPFHFIYDNASEMIPAEVKLFIETNGLIVFKNDMQCNAGNFIIKEDMDRTAASTFFPFDLSGTVHFWYKPFITNKDGYVNYPLDLSGQTKRDITIFDSEYIKIGATVPDRSDDAVFYAAIKSSSTGYIEQKHKLMSHTKLTHAWHHLQVSYDVVSGIAYFYIDGKMAAAIEKTGILDNDLPAFGSITGEKIPEHDNVWIGCSMEQDAFAEGYIDSIEINNKYMPPQYTKNNPVNIYYDKENLTIKMENIQGGMITGFTALLESLDTNKRWIHDIFGDISLATLPGGRYRLTCSMNVNGHHYGEILTFNCTEKPRFILKNHTPVIFQNQLIDVKYSFAFDHAYRLGNKDLVYAGAAVKILYENASSSESLSKTIYIVQNFQTQNPGEWIWGYDTDGRITWNPVAPTNDGLLPIVFEDIQSTGNILTTIKYFYFIDSFSSAERFTDDEQADEDITIPIAALDDIVTLPDSFGYDYKLILKVSGYTGTDSGEFYNDIEFAYTVTNDETGKVSTGSVMSDENGQAELYFDNILPDYGSYHFDVSLLYKGTVYATKSGVQITWDQYYEETPILQATTLEIEDFSLLHLDKERDSVNLYLKYYCENVKPINYTLSVKQANKIYGIPEEGTLEASPNTMLFQNIGIPKNKSTVRITLKTESIEDTGVVFIRTEEIEVNNSISAPEVVFTNSVDSLISYNDVFFSWKGYYEGVFREDIAYSYIFDNSVWSTPSNEWRSIRFYDIDEGYHSFAEKAHYNNMESAVISVSFFVDVNKPTFHDERIHINRVYDDDGVFHAITITGDDGAIDDISLREVYVNGSKVTLGENGSFEARRIPITVDGMMDFTITAVDRVGNYTDHVVHVQNPITRIIFPDITYTVQYSPLTVVGSINESIQSDLSIYLRDPFCTDSTTGEFEGWKKATINPDRTFFVENVFVNPGTVNKEIVTTLTVKTVFASGKEFTRKLVVKANEIIMPIEMKLSTHAAEGENSDTFVEINCRANVQDISSWSIDFDGDGVYDVIDMTDNPSSPESLFHVWTHKYSSLGLVNPRVRIITMDGNFFSVSDTIIIHEKIKEASNKIIDSPLSLDVIRMPDKSERIFVLRQKGENEIIEVFEVGRNETYINKKLFEIDLEQYGIRKANVLRLLGSNHIFIAMNDEEQVDPYRIYELTANEFGNYIVEGKVRLNNKIEDMCIDDQKLFVSFTDQNYLAEIDVKDETLDTESVTYVTPQVTNSFGMSSKTGLAIDKMGILLADYYNQRIIRMSQSLKIVEQFGTIGTGEKEFVKPAIIKSFENRLFVYDEGRQDIQVFDANYRPVCTLEYSLNPEYYNYFTTTFLNDIADMDIIAKEEGNRLYYYVLLLSRSDNTLAMLRLPQWEELRARVRNNKVVFIKDGEVYTAKPNGSDVMKILSTDSLPRIEGQLDYPALAPDGRSLVFTSRKRLYNGEAYGYITDGNEHAYDNLYLIDIETKELKLLDLGEVNNYELERPVFNYNGDKLIFSAKPTGGNWQIFVYDIKEKSIDWLFRSDEDARFPYYSPDDRFVVFTTTYDGDEDISIIDTKNPNVRVYVTDNMCRDSFPVWSRIYPLEINTNDEILKDVTSKIAFVSERDRPKGVHIVYLKRMSEDDIQVFDLYQKQISGEDPDEASIEITNSDVEGDYPCFTGDGRSLLFEHFKGGINRIKRFDFAGIDPDDMGENGDINKQEMLKDNPQFIFEDIEILEGSLRPAGMKNTITNFAAANQNGNEITLTWDRYTSQNIFYTVQFKAKSESAEAGEKKIFDQQQAVITGLKLGYTYLVRVCIEENRVVVATSQWQEVKMPHVVARPMYEIDEENPYGVHLKGWKPDVDDTWKFTWFIENKKIEMGTTDEFYYHFATSGTKTICLQVTDSTGNHSDMSDPMEVIIISDIVPVIEYVLADDSSYIDLDATKSRGENINEAATVWIISGPGRDEIQVTGSKNTAQLNGFQYKVNITLRLSRLPVEGQSAADTREKSIVVDLDFKELKPIITYQVNPLDERLIKFSGEQSLGNIDWYRAEWTIFADNAVICDRKGVSTFEYLFPERTKTTTYTITLTIPRRNDGMTETVSQIIDVEAKPLEPVIGYEILTMKKAGDTVGYKVLFDCSKSRGNDIDFTLSRWSVPGVDIYGEQSVQFGPTAIYNLLGIESGIVIEVALTLFRTGGKDPVTITKFIPLRTGEFPEAKLIVNETIEESSEGKVLVLDVLKSTGPNINWERTEWFVDGQSLPRRGPVVRYDIPAVDTDQVINYTCTFYRYGQDPEIYHGAVTIGKATITPIISWKTFGSQKNLIEMDVFESDGVNIDWDRSAWYIYDGNETVVQKQGAKIAHAFALTEENMGYPVMVNMYFKGGSFPFVGYKNIDVEGDELIPVFDIEQSSEDSLIFIFSAENSSGSNIDWTQTKWTFLDTSESLYGPVVAHKFPADDVDRTYMVRLTLVRKSSTGIVETKSLTQEIDITKDEIIPAVTAKLYDDYLVLSAEGSTGKGLLLDRSVWMFPGEGDTGSYSAHYEGGVINRGNINLSAEAYLRSNTNIYSQAQVGTEIDIGFFGGHLHLGGENGCFFKAGVRNDIDIGASLQTGGAYTTEVVDYSNYTNENKSFSASNMHTGAVCRRYAGDVNNVIVTLFIFRMNKDGGMTGKSITVKIDLKKVKTEPETYK
jgi:Tol biopolymer transport system component